MTRMLDQLVREMSRRRTKRRSTLMGSSLGGTLACSPPIGWARRWTSVVLLAPAVMFAKPGHHLLPPERIDEWRRRGALPFFHYGYNEERPLDYGFYEDSLQLRSRSTRRSRSRR